MKKITAIFLILLSAMKGLGQSGYITKDSTILGWNVRITYNPSVTDSVNAFLFLPGLGEVGTDVTKLRVNGPHYWLLNGWDGGIVLGNGTHYPVYISLQPNTGFPQPQTIKPKIDALITRFKIRRQGLLTLGLSAGGGALQNFIYYEPTLHDHTYANMVRFVFSMQGVRSDDNYGADPYSYPNYMGHGAKNAPNLRWLAMEQWNDGRNLGATTKNMIDSVGSNANIVAGKRFSFFWTSFGSGGHTNFNDQCSPYQTNWTLTNANVRQYQDNVGGYATIPMNTGQNIWQFMLRNAGDTSLAGGGNTPPSVSAGSNQSLSYPAFNSTSVTGTASDADGTITGTLWTQQSGPNTSTITTPTSLSTTITGLVPGVYVFRLTATDDDGTPGNSELSVTVVNSIYNAPPIVSAGSNQTIAITSATLAGSATDDSGSIVQSITSILRKPSQSVYSIAVIGSSTSAGTVLVGQKANDSLWVNQLKAYLKSYSVVDTIYNLGQATITPYEAMPTGFVSGIGGRPAIDPTINLTAAMNKPGVDVIIANFPTNGYDYMSVAEVMNLFRIMRDTCNARGIKFFLTTTQQRKGFSPTEEARLVTIKDSILVQFGSHAINFWNGFNDEGTLDPRPDFDKGDNVHTNGLAQLQYGKQAIARNVLQDLVVTPPTVTTPTSLTSTVTSLSTGVYIVQMSAKDNDSLWNTSTVSITVNSVTPPACNELTPVTYNLSPSGSPGTWEIYMTNASAQPWKGGDTLNIPAGTYTVIEIDSFGGDPCRDIYIRNVGGQVIVNGPMRFGKDMHHVKIMGDGAAGVTYGFKCSSFAFGRANHLTIERVEAGPNIEGVGMYGKQDPYVNQPWTQYPNYVNRRITINNCYVHDVDGEGMYIGHTAPDGDPYNEGIIPQRGDSITISNCRVENTGWDGIQLSNARDGCLIFGNTVTNFGIKDIDGQRAGIISGGNTNSQIYSNTVSNGKGNGIEVFGYGQMNVYNNSITDVGKTTSSSAAGNGEESYYGMAYVNGVETNPKQYMIIHDNQFNYPKPRGAIRIWSNSNSDSTNLYNNNFCFFTPPAPTWKSQYIAIDGGYYDVSNILSCFASAPTAYAGPDQLNLVYGTTSTTLSSVGSTGTITAYAWTQIEGPNTATITTPDADITTVTGLVTGTYRFRLTLNTVSTDDVIISINSSSTDRNNGKRIFFKGKKEN